MGHTVNDRLVLLFLISQNFDISWSGADHGAPITVLTAVIWRREHSDALRVSIVTDPVELESIILYFVRPNQ